MENSITSMVMELIIILIITSLCVVSLTLYRMTESAQSNLTTSIDKLEQQAKEPVEIIQKEVAQETVTQETQQVVERIIERERIIEKPVIQEVIKEVEKPVIADISGVGTVVFGIAFLVLIIALIKGGKRFLRLKKEKLEAYKSVMSRPLDTFGDSEIDKLTKKYN